MRKAVIDIGTHSVLFLAVDDKKDRRQILFDESVTTLLGEGMQKSSSLSESNINATAEVVKSFYDKAIANGIDNVSLFGTAALREAKNANGFLRSLGSNLMKKTQILSGKEEASYTFWANSRFDSRYGNTVVIDMGGGSTEVVYGSRDKIVEIASFDYGVVKFFEKMDSNIELSIENFEELEKMMDLRMADSKLSFPFRDTCAVLVGGTVTTLVAIKEQLKQYDSALIDGYQLSRSDLWEIFTTINQMDLSGRYTMRGMEKGRAPYMALGTLMLIMILKKMGISTFKVSVKGARYGILNGVII